MQYMLRAHSGRLEVCEQESISQHASRYQLQLHRPVALMPAPACAQRQQQEEQVLEEEEEEEWVEFEVPLVVQAPCEAGLLKGWQPSPKDTVHVSKGKQSVYENSVVGGTVQLRRVSSSGSGSGEESSGAAPQPQLLACLCSGCLGEAGWRAVTCACNCMHMYTHMQACLYAYLCTPMLRRLHEHMYSCVHAHTCTHARTHMHASAWIK